MRILLPCVVVFLAFAGCSNRENLSPMPSISDDARAAMKKPVNCARAKSDIALLEEERASVAKRILSGVRMVFPVAAVAGLVLGDYGDRYEVATGEYNFLIETKITQIKDTCNIA